MFVLISGDAFFLQTVGIFLVGISVARFRKRRPTLTPHAKYDRARVVRVPLQLGFGIIFYVNLLDQFETLTQPEQL